MGIDISMWRQRIGVFNCSRISCNVKSKCFCTRQVLPFLSVFISIVISISLVISGVELNPGPTVITDNFNCKYQRLVITGDGLCVYRSLSYCLTGTETRFADIIEDCINVFRNYEQLFSERTEYGRTGNIESYCTYMTECIAKVKGGVPLIRDADEPDRTSWGDEGHIIAISLLYDIRIYVFCQYLNNPAWQVYNNCGENGYICLIHEVELSSDDHVTVLHGIDDICPTIPSNAYRAGYIRHELHWNIDTDAILQRKYPFTYVWHFPITYIHDKFADKIAPMNMQELFTKPISKKTQSMCNICQREFSNLRSLNLHKVKAHNEQLKCNSTISCNSITSTYDQKDSTKASLNAAIATSNDTTLVDKVHNMNGKFQCPFCKKCYTNLANHKKCRKGGANVNEHSAIESQTFENNDCNVLSVLVDNNNTKILSKKVTKRPVRSRVYTSSCESSNDCTSVSTDTDSLSDVKSIVKSTSHRKQYCRGKRQKLIKPTVVCHNLNDVNPDDTEKGANNYDSSDNCNNNSNTLKQSHNDKRYYDMIRKQKLVTIRKEELGKKHPCKASLLHKKLKQYHDQLIQHSTDTVTWRLSPEVLEVIEDVNKVGDESHKITCSQDDLSKISNLTEKAKELQIPEQWTWAADDNSKQGKYNHRRMKYWLTEELKTKIIECINCGCSSLLIGEEIDATICKDCMVLKWKTIATELNDAWKKVRPKTKSFPKRVEIGCTNTNLPNLSLGEKSVIAPVHPVVTVKKNYYACKKLRQESISLIQNPDSTWARILPRTDLRGRFMIIERTAKNGSNRYVSVNPENVRQWLKCLFKTHPEFIQMKADGKLRFSEEAMQELEKDKELAEIDDDYEESECLLRFEGKSKDNDEQGIAQASLLPGCTDVHTFAFEKLPQLYIKKKDILKLHQQGKIEIVNDSSERKRTYNVSATIAFPYLYPNGEASPLDFKPKLAIPLLKKQTLYAHDMMENNVKKQSRNKKLQWTYAEDKIHMMWQFAHLQELIVNSSVGFYLSQHPEVAHIPIDMVVKAFQDGVDEHGLIDSQLPGLTQIMTQLPNTGERWYSERLGLDTISRDLGDPNYFLTLNMDPRSWADCRRLLYQLEYGIDSDMPPDWFEKNTAKFTTILNKHAAMLAIYLQRKAETFIKMFFYDICEVPEKENADWTKQDRFNNGWFFSRVEFTDTRGVQHYHCIAKLPYVLDTGILGRMIQNGRVVRQELKCSNICSDKMDEAWEIIELGLLAQRYVILLTDSLSSASFYDVNIQSGLHDANRVLNLDELRAEFVHNYTDPKTTVSRKNHPIMRTFDDVDENEENICEENPLIEIAKIASVSQIHQCMPNSCGGDEKTGVGCRFDYPKKKMNQTVVAIMQVNYEQMEARVLHRRTHERVNAINKYVAFYWRGNHDSTVLIDAAHCKRYVTEYVSKGSKHSEVMQAALEYVNSKSTDTMPQNIKHVLINLLLANNSQHTFVSEQELAYKVMDLPLIIRSFAKVEVQGSYRRSSILPSYTIPNELVYSDRTQYAAYAERCRDTTVNLTGLNEHEIESMCLRNFVECIKGKWQKNKNENTTNIDAQGKRKLRSCVVGTGYWILKKRRKRCHVRFSSASYTDLAAKYVLLDQDCTTSQTTFGEMSIDKRKQLARAYYEIVVYVPWQNSPDETFLSEEIRTYMNANDPEKERRYSVMCLEQYHTIYMQKWNEGIAAKPGSLWHRDLQSSYTMFLVHGHNSNLKLERTSNEGRLVAQFEPADELSDTTANVRPEICTQDNDNDYPSPLGFFPPDNYKPIFNQKPMNLDEISVAFPTQPVFQNIQNLVMIDKSKRFMCNPPSPCIPYDQLSAVQKWAIDMAESGDNQILYLCGKASCGKTTVALHICSKLKGRVQAGSCTGKAASNFNGPTVHGMFGLSQKDFSNASLRLDVNSQKIQDLRVCYEHTDVFIIDEVNAMSASMLALVHEIMTLCFNRNGTRINGELLPFGGKRMIFMGDMAQLPPVIGCAIHDDKIKSKSTKFLTSLNATRSRLGQELYRKYLAKSCIIFNRGQRNSGLLGEISDNLRNGTQTERHLNMLCYMKRRYPDIVTDRGIHYSNEACSMYNSLELWELCKRNCLEDGTPQRLFVCKASYYETIENQLVLNGLSSLPAKDFNYAPHVLFVAIGCEVRLIQNVNVSAGLVNSAVGKVVKVIYDNSDVKYLLEGKHPSPYCIVVDFAEFQGFPHEKLPSSERIYPFPHKPTWVPIYRQKFNILANSIPAWIRKLQRPSDCYRLQFPLDLSSHITAHRAQGATMHDCLVSVDLDIGNPSTNLPSDICSILYVAITRCTKLVNLFVSYIHPCVWAKLSNSEVDIVRREIECNLNESAKHFSAGFGKLAIVDEELRWKPDYTRNEFEWLEMQRLDRQPCSTLNIEPVNYDNLEFFAQLEEQRLQFSFRPVQSERHVGIDQGEKNFAIVVVDKFSDQTPQVVAADVYDLNLPKRFSVNDVVIALQHETNLLSWMQTVENEFSNTVARVIVHVEQISIHNKNSK